MKGQSVEMHAKIYLYDLNNCANENGFKANEMWELNRATYMEKVELEKKYETTMSAKVLPEMLGELFGLVKDKLILAQKMILDKRAEVSTVPNIEQFYLVAFNPTRLKR